MTRIIAGHAGGRRIATPAGQATRPTSDRVREALFSALEALLGPGLAGRHVLDLYAGSGALGLEAWSRGAESVRFVERDRRTAALITANARDLGCRVAQVRAASVGAALAGGPGAEGGVDVVLADPPYPLAEVDLAADLRALVPWLLPGAVVVLERSSRSPEPTWPVGLEPERSRRYGETTLWWAGASVAAPEQREQPGQPGPSDEPDEEPPT